MPATTAEPPKNVPSFETPLFKQIESSFPQHVERGRLKVYGLADALGVTAQHLYRACAQNKLSANLAKKLVDLSAANAVANSVDPLTLADLIPFVFES